MWFGCKFPQAALLPPALNSQMCFGGGGGLALEAHRAVASREVP